MSKDSDANTTQFFSPSTPSARVSRPGLERRDHADWAKVTVECGHARPGGQTEMKPSEQEREAASAAALDLMKRHFPEGPGTAAQAHWEYARWLDRNQRSSFEGPPQTEQAVRWDTLGKAVNDLMLRNRTNEQAHLIFDRVEGADFAEVRRSRGPLKREDPFRGVPPHEVYGALADAADELARIGENQPLEVEAENARDRCRALLERLDRGISRDVERER